MGSRKLKALVVRGTHTVEVADPEGLIETNKMIANAKTNGIMKDYLQGFGSLGTLRSVEYFLSVSQLLRRYYYSVRQLEYIEMRAHFNDLEINPLQQSVRFVDKVLPVTKKEFDVLWLFMNHPGQILAKDLTKST